MFRSIITGTGKYIPHGIVKNSDFLSHEFYTEDNKLITADPTVTVEKFRQITGIEERRYVDAGMTSSDMATEAARIAIQDSGIDPESIDQIIVAHNYGDITSNSIQSDMVPSLASRVKRNLGIASSKCIPYDIMFGCPGWLQGLIQADLYMKAGAAKTCLVIGTETLSKVVDQHDRDSMIFADGAGACIVEYREPKADEGILSFSVQSDTISEADYIYFGESSKPESDPNLRFIKMKGRKVYEYAIKNVPAAMKSCMDKSGLPISELKKVFIHQANEKMDEGIIKAFYKLYDTPAPENIMPMSIHWLGNSSVATIPTLYDLVRRGEAGDHELEPGDLIMFASVGAGMNINAVCYRY